jgi:hypothetical protein
VEPSAEDFAALGFTPSILGVDIGFGFALVFFFALLGMTPGWVIQLIRKM